MFICSYCNDERKNGNSLRNHERLCKSNPNRQTTPFHDLLFQRVNCENQYTKAKETGVPYIMPETSRKKISDANKARTLDFLEENAKKISASVRNKIVEGTWHTSLARRMHFNYNGVDLHGTWELSYAKYLDQNNIKWIRNKDSFAYIFEGKERRYTPDFYLIESDEYIEIKGYKTEKDEAKWSQFPKHRKLTVLMEDELKMLGILA